MRRDLQLCRVAIFPDSPRANFEYAFFLQKAGRMEEALPLLEKTTEADPAYEEPYFFYGDLMVKQGRHEQAIPHLKKAVENRPDYVAARVTLARAMMSLKQWDEAIEELQEAVRIEPRHPHADSNLDAQKDLTVFLNERRCFFRSRMSDVKKLAHHRGGNANHGDVEVSQQLIFRRLEAIASKLVEVQEARRARVDSGGNACLQADGGIDAERASAVPVPVKVDQAGTQIFPAEVPRIRSRAPRPATPRRPRSCRR